MPREQIWCNKGHYLDLKLSDFHSMSGVTMKGCDCLVENCTGKIVVRNSVERRDRKADSGYIIPTPTEEPNVLQAAELTKRAEQLRIQAQELEDQARAIRLYAIPNPETDRTVIDPKRYLEWHQKGEPSDDSWRIPLSTVAT